MARQDPYLELSTPQGQHLRFRLDGEMIRIGRDPTCDLVLADPRISRDHAMLHHGPGIEYRLEATGQNPTRVNGRTVRRCRVHRGDVIELAGFRMALRSGHDAGEVEATHAALYARKPVARLGRLVARSEGMSQTFDRLRRVADSDAPVLILGESGTGKDLAAQALHEAGLRRGAPFIPLNCGSLPATLVEAELFGHERGAFTGALDRRPGAFEMADSGTLFLDEIGEMPLDMQPRLLRVLESGEVRRIGGSAPFHVDVRIVAATHRDLAQDVAAGRFRADLLYRLRVIEVTLPPLRERPEDLPLLVDCLLGEFGSGPHQLAPGALNRLRSHRWPGNVRELKNVLTRAALLTDGETIPVERLELSPEPEQRSTTLAEAQRAHILEVLGRCQGNRAAAARWLGISRSALFDWLKRYREAGEATPTPVRALEKRSPSA